VYVNHETPVLHRPVWTWKSGVRLGKELSPY
jgi:hypothetical protein